MNEQTIWRFRFPVMDEVVLSGVPRGATFLRAVHADSPHTLSVWAIVNPDAPPEPLRLLVRGTGHPLGDVRDHLGTVVTDVGLVWHVFKGDSR